MMKSYDEEARHYEVYRERRVGVTARRTVLRIPSELTG